MELYASVLRELFLRLGIRNERPGGTEALRDQSLLLYLASADEVTNHGVGTLLRQLHVELEATGRVTVALDSDELDLRVRVHDLGHVIQECERALLELAASGLEVDLLEDLELACSDHDQLGILTTVILHGAGLIRAVVDAVGDAVAVAIGVRTAIVLERARLVWALVVDIEDAVTVVVGIRATVLVLEAVDVFGVHRATVVDIEDTVTVVVGIGTAVLILEAIKVLRLIRTLVDVIQNSVTVGVSDLLLRHGEADHAHPSPVGRAVTGRHARATRHTDHEALRMKVLEAAEHLDRRLFSAPPGHGAVCSGPAEGFSRDHELVLGDHEQQATTKGELVAHEEIRGDQLTLRAELVARLNRNSNDVARIEGHQELEPAADVWRRSNLTSVLLPFVSKAGDVDRDGRLQRDFEHALPSAVQIATKA